MSSSLRIGVVAEGWTDRVVIEAAVNTLLGGRPYELTLLQPEDPAASAPFGLPRRPGWAGVYQRCRESVERAGALGADIVLTTYDLLILHLDADVASLTYQSAHIADAPHPGDLPCEADCPPPAATTDPLRQVLLGWANEVTTPRRVILCTPSKNTEAWAEAERFSADLISLTGGQAA